MGEGVGGKCYQRDAKLITRRDEFGVISSVSSSIWEAKWVTINLDWAKNGTWWVRNDKRVIGLPGYAGATRQSTQRL